MSVTTKLDILKALQEYGVVSKKDLPKAFQEYGVATKDDVDTVILHSERRTAIRLTKVKNDLAQRIANLAVAKAERNKVERIEKRVDTLENFQYA